MKGLNKAVVFAAGAGTRLHPLTVTRPKHLLPLCGKPVLWHVISSLKEIGIGNIGVTIHHNKEQIIKYLEENNPGVKISFIEQEPLGTGHALYSCSEFLKNEKYYITIYGDVVIKSSILKDFINFFNKGNVDGAMMVAETHDPKRYGLVKVKNNLLEEIIEKPSEEEIKNIEKYYINTGVYILSDDALKFFEKIHISKRGEYELTDILSLLAKNGKKIGIFVCEPGWWFDIGLPWDLLEANRKYMDLIEGERVKEFNGVTIDGKVIISKGVSIKPGTYIEGPSIIMDNVSIGANSTIGPYTYIGEKSAIGNSSVIEKTLVLENSIIGDHVSLRNSIIGEGAIIGDNVSVSDVNYAQDITIKVSLAGNVYDIGKKKFGAVIGSYAIVPPLTALKAGQIIMPYTIY
ncbi:MAG: sugar phosphate nucleotidyltransferase [Nitrososphaerota archaeon]